MQQLIYELKLIYKKYQILDKEKSDFNVFKSLLNPYDEVNLHSKMLYTILSEKKYQKEFLICFLKNIGIDPSENNINLQNIVIEREKPIDLGRLDLFISFMANGKDYKIIIENKIYAKDGDHQLDRYLAYLNKIPGDEKYVYYLTLHGDDPSEKSTIQIDDIYSISYENHILDWINECIKISAKEPKIRETLIQYSELIEE